jgi:CRISPR system Cascade subunit CasD
MGANQDDQLRALSERTRMGVRVDAPGERLTDYHTIGGGYDRPALLTAEGKPKWSPGGDPHTELSPRDYLADASFLVALQSDDPELIAQMAHYLQNPVWAVYLGRKSCPPGVPVFAGLGDYPTLKEALKQHRSASDYVRRGQGERVRAVIECGPGEGVRRRDHLVSRAYRRFLPRYTAEVAIEPAAAEEEA